LMLGILAARAQGKADLRHRRFCDGSGASVIACPIVGACDQLRLSQERRYDRGQAKRAACAVAKPKNCPGSVPWKSAPGRSQAPEVPPWHRGQEAALRAAGFAKPRSKQVRERGPSSWPPATPPSVLRRQAGQAIGRARSENQPAEGTHSGLLPVSKKKPRPTYPRLRGSVRRAEAGDEDSRSPGEAAAGDSRKRAATRTTRAARRSSPTRRSPTRSPTRSSS
jgi:hypothetical protein